jgi:hypothetical protein
MVRYHISSHCISHPINHNLNTHHPHCPCFFHYRATLLVRHVSVSTSTLLTVKLVLLWHLLSLCSFLICNINYSNIGPTTRLGPTTSPTRLIPDPNAVYDLGPPPATCLSPSTFSLTEMPCGPSRPIAPSRSVQNISKTLR